MAKKQVELIARGVIVDGPYTLLCRPKGHKYSFLPGGHVEFFENSEEACIREVKEELGVRSKVVRFLGATENTFKSDKKHHEINLCFLLKAPLKYSKRVKSMESHIEFFWWPTQKLHKIQFLPKDLGILLPVWLKSLPQNWHSNA